MSPRGMPATDVSLPWEPHNMQQLLHHQLLPKPLSSVMTPAGIPTAASVTPHNNSLGATSITILFTGAAGIATLLNTSRNDQICNKLSRLAQTLSASRMIKFSTSSQDYCRLKFTISSSWCSHDQIQYHQSKLA